MAEVTVATLAEALRPGAGVGEPPSQIIETDNGVVLTWETTEECVLSIRGDRIEICLPLFAFPEDVATEIIDWALDINFRTPEPGRISLHDTLPVLLFQDVLQIGGGTLASLAAHVERLRQAAEDIRGAIPQKGQIRPAKVTDIEDGLIVFRA